MKVFSTSKEENQSFSSLSTEKPATMQKVEERMVHKEKRSPPEAPKTAFMCFSLHKEKIISSHQTLSSNATNEGSSSSKQDSSKHFLSIADEWRNLSHEERAFWDEEARKDKMRFANEKATYSGTWDVPKRRVKKHPLAPKRPMSAFLKFSQTRRKLVKSENPDINNTDVSRLLGEMWRSATAAERNPYIEEEARERKLYKVAIAKFKSEQARREAFRLEIERESAFGEGFDSISCQKYQQEVENYSSHYRNTKAYCSTAQAYGGGQENTNISRRSPEPTTQYPYMSPHVMQPLSYQPYPYCDQYPTVGDTRLTQNPTTLTSQLKYQSSYSNHCSSISPHENYISPSHSHGDNFAPYEPMREYPSERNRNRGNDFNEYDQHYR